MVRLVFSPGGFLFAIKKSVIAAKLGACGLLIPFAVALMLVFSGCGEYGHIPLAGQENTPEKADTVRVVLQWNHLPDAANPIAITDLEPDRVYYFVVTVAGDAGESKESKEMSFAGLGAAGVIDFRDLFEQPSPLILTPPVKHCLNDGNYLKNIAAEN